MEQWKLVTILVTVFAFSLDIRPLDSFLTAYLTGPKINVTLKEISDILTPIRLYSGVLGTLLVLLLSDYLRYKPIMVFNGLIGMLTYVCLMGSPTTFDLKVAEVGLSLFSCAEVSYFGYLYTKIKGKEHYQTATGYVKAGMLSGRFVSGLLGQFVVYLKKTDDYSTLPYYSLASVTFAFAWACFLPSVKDSEYVCIGNTVPDATEEGVFSKEAIQNTIIPKYSAEKSDLHNVERTTTVTGPFKSILKYFKEAYMDREVLRWSFWHIVGMAGYMQVFLYINILYTYIANKSNDNHILLNGVVDSFATISAALCTYNVGKLDVEWNQHSNKFLAFISLAIGMVLYFCSFLKNIIVVYIMYIIFIDLVHSVFVISTSQIAKRLEENCYTLVLGFNAFLANVLSTSSSMIIVYMEMSIPNEFLVYSGTFVGLGIVYGYASIFNRKLKLGRFERLY